jgi:putative transposase
VLQSLGRIYVHAVFATKNREPLILQPEPPRLHAYLVGVLAELGCPSLATGGVEDHVHILHALGRTHSVAWVMEKLKSNSSRWMKEQGAEDFWWQPGYAAFSVGPSELERVRGYIHRRREHYRQHSFEHELRALCGREPADAAALDEFLNQQPRRATLTSQRCSPRARRRRNPGACQPPPGNESPDSDSQAGSKPAAPAVSSAGFHLALEVGRLPRRGATR